MTPLSSKFPLLWNCQSGTRSHILVWIFPWWQTTPLAWQKGLSHKRGITVYHRTVRCGQLFHPHEATSIFRNKTKPSNSFSAIHQCQKHQTHTIVLKCCEHRANSFCYCLSCWNKVGSLKAADSKQCVGWAFQFSASPTTIPKCSKAPDSTGRT